MKYTRFLVLLLIAVACVGDPQDIPPGFAEDPVFSAEITLDGMAGSFEAGVDGYILDVHHESTDRGVVQYTAQFRKSDCLTPPCGPELEFVFWDNSLSAQPGSGVETTFQVGEKTYYASDEGLLDVLVALQEEAAVGTTALWTDGLGQVLGQGTSVTITSLSDAFVDLCFSTVGDASGTGTGCLSSICFHMKPSTPCIAWLKAERMVDEHALVEVEVIGQAPFTYKWMNGENTPFILMPIYTDRPTGVSVVVTDANGCETVIHQTMRMVDGRPVICSGAPGFSVDIFDAVFSQFGTVEVRYTDEDGKTFSTAYAPQSEASMFVLDTVDDYLESPDGFPTKQLMGVLSCVLHSPDGQENIALEVQSLSVAISYQE